MQGRRPAHQEWSIRGGWEGAPHISTMARCLQIVKILIIMIFTMKQYLWNTDMNTETTTKYWGGRHIFQWWPNLNISEVLWGCIWMCACMYAPLYWVRFFSGNTKCASVLVDYRRLLLGNCTRFEGNKMLLHTDNAVPDGDEGGAKEETIKSE